jgi:hypothetical protein
LSRQKDREDEFTRERLKMDDRTLLAAIGEALYRQSWKTELAGDLNVDDRSLRRWIQTGEVPEGVWRDLIVLLADRRGVIDSLLIAVRERS